MKVLSVNIGARKKIKWKSKTVETGIYKKPVDSAIALKISHVENDHVVDLKHHGGNDMAVYAYSKNHYEYFEKMYPELIFNNGIFGENITVNNLFETEVCIGDVFKIGSAIIQVSQPRYPCYKLGIVFGSQKIVKQFLNTTYCGFYFRVIKEGKIKKNDTIVLIKKAEKSMTVAEVFSIYRTNKKNKEVIKKAIKLEFLANKCKDKINKLL